MKISLAFFLLLSLLLIGENVSEGRKDRQGEYWKKVMKDEAIPKILKELLFDESSMVSSSSSSSSHGQDNEKKRFMNNFDTHPNAIIYHSHSTATHNNNHPHHHHPHHDLKTINSTPNNSSP